MSKANKAKGGNRTVVIAAIGLAIVVAALLLVAFLQVKVLKKREVQM